MNAALALIEELDGALAGSTAARRAEIIHRIADLFVLGAPNFSNDQIGLFDDVFTRLAAGIEASARAALAQRLATNPFSPPRISRVLAFDDVIDAAAPVLEFSNNIDNGTLVQSARCKSQDHLLAISRRQTLDAVVTDVLVERGNKPVLLSTTRNSGARFSDFGFKTLVDRAQGDDELAMSVGGRRELPRHFLLKLLARASEAVRAKLEKLDPLSSDAIRKAVAEAAEAIQVSTTRTSYDYATARTTVEAMQAAGGLNEDAVAGFARAGKFEESAIALTLLCRLPIEQTELAMVGNRPEAMIILAKAIGMSWPTVKLLLTMHAGGSGLTGQTLEQCLGTYSRLKPATARQVMEFQRRRAAAGTRTKPVGAT